MPAIEWPGWLKWEATAALAFAWSGLFVAFICSLKRSRSVPLVSREFPFPRLHTCPWLPLNRFSACGVIKLETRRSYRWLVPSRLYLFYKCGIWESHRIGGWNAKSRSFVKDQKTVILSDDHDKTGKLQVCHVCYTPTFSLSFSFYRPRMCTFTLWEPPPREEAQMSLQYKLCEEEEKLLWSNQTKGRQRKRLKFNYRHS